MQDILEQIDDRLASSVDTQVERALCRQARLPRFRPAGQTRRKGARTGDGRGYRLADGSDQQVGAIRGHEQVFGYARHVAPVFRSQPVSQGVGARLLVVIWHIAQQNAHQFVQVGALVGVSVDLDEKGGHGRDVRRKR